MSIFEYSRSPWTGRTLSILRIVTGLVFVTEGTMKLFGFPPSPTPMPPIHFPSPLAIAGLLELIGGICILLGLFTRAVAFVLAGEMAVAYFTVHFPKSFFPTTSGGVPAVLFCFIYLYMTFAGGGPWSIDALIARSRRAEPLPMRRELEPKPERIRRTA
jgi:putative oxidoreductase